MSPALLGYLPEAEKSVPVAVVPSFNHRKSMNSKCT
jgi:hypothetical protein